MKNIWKIFTGDLKKLVKQPFALVIIIGLCVIPSLYAWFNIFANWDPYANTGGIPVAVVSLDQDYTLKDGSVVNMGESVLESLHSNTSVKWIFLDTEEEAKEGVEAGKYYAAVVITDKFTYSMYNLFSDDFENPALIYYQNQMPLPPKSRIRWQELCRIPSMRPLSRWRLPRYLKRAIRCRIRYRGTVM